MERGSRYLKDVEMDVDKIVVAFRQSLDMLVRGARRTEMDVGTNITLSTRWVTDVVIGVDIKSKVPLRFS